MILSLLHTYYFYGCIAAFVVLIIEHAICKTGFNGDDFYIILIWPYFVVYGFCVVIKGIYNLSKHYIQNRKIS